MIALDQRVFPAAEKKTISSITTLQVIILILFDHYSKIMKYKTPDQKYYIL